MYEYRFILRTALCIGLTMGFCLASSDAQQTGTNLDGPVTINTTYAYGMLDVNGGYGTDFINKEIPAIPYADYSYNYLKLFQLTTGSGQNSITINANICALRGDDIGITQCAIVHVSRSYDSTIYFSEIINAGTPSNDGPFQLVTLNDGGISWVSLLYDNHLGATMSDWTIDGTVYNADSDPTQLSLAAINSTTSIHSALPFTSLNTSISVGNVGIGTATPGQNLQSLNSSGILVPYSTAGHVLEVSGIIALSTGQGGSILFPDGTVQSTAYLGNSCPTGGDYAESVDVLGDRAQYEPGDVMVISSDTGSDVSKSFEPYSTMIAGIYSTKPGVVGRRQTYDPKLSRTEIPMAMVGIVPTKVSAENGPIRRGDLMVSSSIAGYAMKGTDRSRMVGAVLGKALGSLDSGTGVIEVLVSLQ